MTCEPTKPRFLILTQASFRAGQKEENGFVVPSDHLKHRFLNHKQVAFWVGQEAGKSSQYHENL